MRSPVTSTLFAVRALAPTVSALLGVAALIPASLRYGILHATCANAPDPEDAGRFALINGVAFALLGVSWLLAVRAAIARPGRSPILGAIVRAAPAHLLAVCVQPFLSTDPVFYAALGRVIAIYHGSVHQAVSR